MPHTLRRFAVGLSLVATVGVLAGAGSGPIRRLTQDPDAPRVELFAGIEDRTLEVRVSPRDEFQAVVSITNTTDKPVTVVAPEGVAAVHVLKQFPFPQQGNSANGPLGQNSQGEPGNSQSVAGQFGSFSQQGNNPFSGSGPSFFSVPAEKTVQILLRSVCLDYGKRTPSSRMTYELRRLEDHCSNPALVELFRMPDLKKVDRSVLQAAAWHLSNGLSFPELASKSTGIGVKQPLFTAAQLNAAKALVDAARKAADTAKSADPRVAGN